MIKIVIVYVCECGNKMLVTGDISDGNLGIAHKHDSSMVVYTQYKVICLDCGQTMKLLSLTEKQ